MTKEALRPVFRNFRRIFIYLGTTGQAMNFQGRRIPQVRELQLLGWNWTPENSGSIYNTLSLDVDQCNIVVLHGQESEYSARDKAEIIHLTALKNKGIDYSCPGTHPQL